MTAEQQRLQATHSQGVPWKKWGPYLSDRQWGTVREDYSATVDAWDYISHEQYHNRVNRWGEAGILSHAKDQQGTCIALTLRNG